MATGKVPPTQRAAWKAIQSHCRCRQLKEMSR